MAHFTLECCEIVADAVGIFSIGATVLYLTILRYKGYRGFFKKASNVGFRIFNDEVLIQLIRQQFNTSFGKILHALDQEQRIMLQYLAQVSEENNLKPSHAEDVDHIMANGTSCAVGHEYDDVIKLADSDLNANDISEKLRIPIGEVELVLKLNDGN